MFFKQCLGTTGQVLLGLTSEDRTEPFRSFFFKPYKSIGSTCIRTLSIVTDPLIIGFVSAFFTLFAGIEILKTLGHLLICNLSSAAHDINQAGENLLLAGALFIIAIFSPAINLIDLVGGGINSIKECFSKPKESSEYQFQPSPN